MPETTEIQTKPKAADPTLADAKAAKPPTPAPPPAPKPVNPALAKLLGDTPLRLHLAAQILGGGRVSNPKQALALVDALIVEACGPVGA